MTGDKSRRPATEKVDRLLLQVADWAAEQDDIRAVLLVGSYARGNARDNSDVDLVLLVDDPGRFTQSQAWSAVFGPVERVKKESWGKVTSFRVWYPGGLQIEFAVASSEWARLPLDEGSARVLRDGFRAVYDPGHLFSPVPPHWAAGPD